MMPLFDKAEYLQRLSKVKKVMSEKGIDALLVYEPANICYLTGYNANSYYVPQTIMVTLGEEMPYYFGRQMDFIGITRTTWITADHVYTYNDSFLQQKDRHPVDAICENIKALGYGNKTFGLEMDNYWFTAYSYERYKLGLPNANFVNTDGLVNWIRLIKSDNEIEMIRRAGLIIQKMMTTAAKVIIPGIRQCDAMAEIYKTAFLGTPEYGGDYPSGVPNMPVGEMAGAPHLTWTDEPLPYNTILYVELGGVYYRYHCPMTRSFSLGKPSPKVQKYANMAIEGLEEALSRIRPGVPVEEIEAGWRSVTSRYGFEKKDRMGYSLGLSYPPDWGEHNISIRAGEKTLLQPNMVLHVIPGIYQEDFGLTISQCVRVTETGYDKFYDFPYDLIIKE